MRYFCTREHCSRFLKWFLNAVWNVKKSKQKIDAYISTCYVLIKLFRWKLIFFMSCVKNTILVLKKSLSLYISLFFTQGTKRVSSSRNLACTHIISTYTHQNFVHTRKHARALRRRRKNQLTAVTRLRNIPYLPLQSSTLIDILSCQYPPRLLGCHPQYSLYSRKKSISTFCRLECIYS
jgi:hypothetical protein